MTVIAVMTTTFQLNSNMNRINSQRLAAYNCIHARTLKYGFMFSARNGKRKSTIFFSYSSCLMMMIERKKCVVARLLPFAVTSLPQYFSIWISSIIFFFCSSFVSLMKLAVCLLPSAKLWEHKHCANKQSIERG